MSLQVQLRSLLQTHLAQLLQHLHGDRWLCIDIQGVKLEKEPQLVPAVSVSGAPGEGTQPAPAVSIS